MDKIVGTGYQMGGKKNKTVKWRNSRTYTLLVEASKADIISLQ